MKNYGISELHLKKKKKKTTLFGQIWPRESNCLFKIKFGIDDDVHLAFNDDVHLTYSGQKIFFRANLVQKVKTVHLK